MPVKPRVGPGYSRPASARFTTPALDTARPFDSGSDVAFAASHGGDDVDLHITCPANDTLYFMQPATCNGLLDVDSNAQEVTPDPIENAHFSDPLPGTYRVRVNLYKSRDNADTRPFTLQIRDRGRVTTHRGSVSRAQPNWQQDYRYEGQ